MSYVIGAFKMLKIGEFAKLNKVTIKTLRYYDKLGLLKPIKTDTNTGYRFYSIDQMQNLNKIISFKNVGFSLDEIYLIITKNMKKDEIKNLLELKHIEISKKIEDNKSTLLHLEVLMKRFAKEDVNMKYDVVLKTIEPILVASLRAIIPNYSEQGHLWEELVEHIEKHKVKILTPCMAIYHDSKGNENYVDAEVIEPISEKIPETDRIKVKHLEKFEKMACVVHKGPFENINMAYNAVLKWIEENKYSIAGPQRELYLKGEWVTNNPEEYISEVQIPVTKK
jgi:effector-binding domain-containing protein